VWSSKQENARPLPLPRAGTNAELTRMNRATIARLAPRLVLMLTVGVVAITTGCGKMAPIYTGTLHETQIVVFTKQNPKSLVSVHADKTKVLQIGQLQFEDVRGFGRSFQEIDELRTLVFVTEEGGGAFIHAFDLSKNVDVKAPLGDASGFGYWLGSSNRQHESVAMIASNKLLLSIMGPSYPERKPTRWEFVFDLDRKDVRLSAKKEL
jgi:hypothetical protein